MKVFVKSVVAGIPMEVSKETGETKKHRLNSLTVTFCLIGMILLYPAFSVFAGAGLNTVVKIVSKADTAVTSGNYGNKASGLLDGETGEAIDWASDATGVALAGSSLAGVAGSSGAGVVSTLSSAAVPGVVANAVPVIGSAAAGPAGGAALIAGSGGVATAGILNKTVFRDDENLLESERSARRAARCGTHAGAITGTVAGGTAIYMAGTTGISAAGITSGLATIGAGSMVAGTAAVILAPAAAAAALGYGAYVIWKWAKE